MKKFILLLAISSFAFTSCYDDYLIDYDTQAVGFANHTDVRSVIVGEGMKFSTGVALGGVINNEADRVISYEIDESLVNDETLNALKTHSLGYITSLFGNIDELHMLPEEEYNLKNSGGQPGKTVIRAGSHLGTIEIQVDSTAFLNGGNRLVPDHVIPFRITDTGSDDLQIMAGYETTVIAVRYENMLFGNYWHGGEAEVVSPSGESRTVTYDLEVPQSDNMVWTLTTDSPYSLTANAIANELNGSAAQMRLTLDCATGKITVSAVDGAPYQVEPDGESYYNMARLLQDREIHLSYKFTDENGDTWHCKDVLQFRNRVRDGVNEWQDENPEHYN